MLCPCHSKQLFKHCCAPYLNHEKKCENALVLMRSRYSAYALKNIDYIIETTDPSSSAFEQNLDLWKKQILDFATFTQFNGLEIIDFKENNNEALVTFKAILTQQGRNVSFQEKSFFIKKDRWLYCYGDVTY